MGRFRLTLEQAEKEFNKVDLKLLAKEYSCSSIKMSYQCKVCNYRGSSTLVLVKRGHGCPKCSKKLKRTLIGAKEEFAKLGLVLLEKEYINNKTKMRYRCNVCGHKGMKRLDNIVSCGTGCPNCKNTLKKDLFYVKRAFDKQDLELLDTEYVNNKTRLLYKCKKCFHLGSKRLNDLQSGRGCPVCSRGSISKMEIKWLDSLSIPNMFKITRQVPITVCGVRYKADGFDPETNTIYEFLGDYYHGNPKKYRPQDINPTIGKTYGQLYKDVCEKIKILKKAGYKVIYIWESDFK